jgi:threonine aldolase
MDRRHFLAASAAAASAPWFGGAPLSAAQAAATLAPGLSSTRIYFTADGLALDPREYAALLHEIAGDEPLQADGYSRGGLVAELERAFAQRLGKPAALFVPTGTLANLLAVRALAGASRRVLVQLDSHLYNDSGDGAATLAGLTLLPVAGRDGALTRDDLRPWLERSAGGRVATPVGALSIENPVRRADHRMLDFDELARIAELARERGVRLHLDGARLFNLPRHSRRDVREHAALFDTVYVSLWKHFNGASGAILAGPADVLDGLHHARRMFGGALPQAWPQVAPVRRFFARYEDDYARAWIAAERVFERLQSDARFRITRLPNGTSRVFLDVAGVDADAFAARLDAAGLVIAPPWPGTTRFWLQVNPTWLRRTPEAIAAALLEAAAT